MSSQATIPWHGQMPTPAKIPRPEQMPSPVTMILLVRVFVILVLESGYVKEKEEIKPKTPAIECLSFNFLNNF